MDERDRIIEWLADQECKRIVGKIRRALQGMTEGRQSGDDSGLANLWDEVCMQRQVQESGRWEWYMDINRDLIERQVNALSLEQTEAIWLQTENGFGWDFDENEPLDLEYSQDDIVDHILDQVLTLADNWNNRRIESYINAQRDFD